MKRCARCATDKPIVDFCRKAAAPDGRCSWCKDCQRDYMRGRKGDPAKRIANARRSEKRHPAQHRARRQVAEAIRRGDLPPASTLPCVDCGRPAASYDHADHTKPLAVEAVCHEDHGKRSRVRGEHRNSGPRKRLDPA